MSQVNQEALELFKKKAAPVSIQVVERKNLREAMSYALEVCEKKEPCRLLLPEAAAAAKKEGTARKKVVAAPSLEPEDYAFFAAEGEKRGFTMLQDGLRDRLAGIDVGFTPLNLGIAETATCVLASNNEETRIATMVCEIHVAALPKSKILASLFEAEDALAALIGKEASYTAFISGPSRTADIERVLTLGVHGPLELHVVLTEE